MKKILCLILVATLAFASSGCKSKLPDSGYGSESGGESHVHEYNFVKGVKATCTQGGNKPYYECGCGKMFLKKGIDYVETSVGEITLSPLGHTFTKEVLSDEYLVAEATKYSPQIFYKVCDLCGIKSETDTFTFGKTLVEYEKEDKSLYKPTSLTMTLYDAADCVYGFTWNTSTEPARPIVRIKDKATETETEVRATFGKASSYEQKDGSDKSITYYSCKAEVALTPNSEYVYSVGDKYIDVFGENAEIKSVNPSESGKWKFVHVSDSQAEGNVSNGGLGTGAAFANVLKNVVDSPDVRFMVHTGDVVEYSKYQSYWYNMLDANFEYLSKIPVMAISGNHETTYKNGTNETYNRFNYKIPEQKTELGFYYSFSYGDVKFLMLNTNCLNGSKLTNDQYNWLENELKNKTEKWTVVSMHNPMYSVGKWGSDKSRNGIALALAYQLKGLFARYKVDVVLQGHDHMVSRTHPLNENGEATEEKIETSGGVDYIRDPDGVIYVMNGPAGDQAKGESSIYEHDESLYAYALPSKVSSWAEFEISDDTLTVVVKSAQSGVTEITKWGIKKSA